MPTYFPSLSPTQPSSDYDFKSFNVSAIKYKSQIKDELFFTYFANKVNEFISAYSAWESFVQKSLNTPFSLSYVFVELNSTGLVQGKNNRMFYSSVTCSDISASNAIVQAIRMGKNTINIFCDGHSWRIENSTLFVNSAVGGCPSPSGSVLMLLPPPECSLKAQLKMASSLRIRQTILPNPGVPTILLPIKVNALRDRFYVNVSIAGSSKGIVYCAAMKSGLALTSVNSVKIMNFRSVIKSGKKNATHIDVQVLILGLTPVTTYDTYCYAEDLFGNGNILSSVLRSKASQTTACCKSLTFVNAPPSVYGNLTNYMTILTSHTASLNSQTFTYVYQLESAPTLGVRVRHKVTDLQGQVTAAVTPVPSSLSFVNSSSPATISGSFILSGVIGSYLIWLEPLGESAAEFTSASSSVILLSDVEAVRAPSLTSFLFENDGNFATASFDTATNQGNIVSMSWPCNLIFFFNGVESASCSWTSLTTVRLAFPNPKGSPTLEPGDSVLLLGGVLRAFCVLGINLCVGYESSHAMSVIASYPINAVVPTVIISVPSILGPCADLIIDATASTGNCGRSWRYVAWSINASSGAATATALMTLLSNFSETSSPLTIPPHFLPAGSYSFSLHLENFLGKSSVSSAVVQILKSEYYLPSVTIIGSTFRSISRSDEFSVQMLATVPHCASDKNLTYSWSVYNNYVFVGIVSTSKDPRRLTIVPYTLLAGETYQVIGKAMTSYGESAIAIASVYVSVGSIYAIIDGGYSRLVSRLSTVTLDASPSIDSDEEISGANNLLYSWTCFVLSLSRYGSPCALPLPRVPVLTIPGELLEPSVRYKITLVVTSSSNGDRSSSAEVVLQTTSFPPILADINSQFFLFNPSDKLKINSSIMGNSSVLAEWTVSGPTAVNFELENVALTPPNRNFSRAETHASMTFPLVISAHVFTPGCSYTFTLSIYIDNGFHEFVIASSKQITLTANGPPTSGFLAISPENGTAVQTQFLLAAVQWTDVAADFPLTFQFQYSISSSASLLSLGTRSEKSYVETVLPAGILMEAYVITCVVNVSDVHGSSTWSTTNATVSPAGGSKMLSAVAMSISMGSALASAFDSQDIDAALRTVNTLATILNYVNCTGAPECTKLHREDCSKIPHSCGLCVTGYVGIPEASNSICNSIQRYIPLGSPCTPQNADSCYYGYCLDGICSTPLKSCPTANPSLVCSGHGNCSFTDSLTKELLLKCSVGDSSCEAQCKCSDGYGGRDCDIGPEEMVTRYEIRNTLCSSIVRILGLQDNSSYLLLALANSFVASFNPFEHSTEGSECSQALQAVAQLAATGVLSIGSGAEWALAEGISSYLVVNGSGNANFNSSNQLTTTSDLLIQGLHRDMVGGQAAVFVRGSYLSISTNFELLSVLANRTFQASLLDNSQPEMTLPPAGMDLCGFSGGYAKFAFTQWDKSPFSSELALKGSPLSLTFSKSVVDNAPSDYLTDVESQTYHVVLQFSNRQDWSVRKPDCTLIQGSVHVPCPCNVSSYSDYNVTLKCHNFALLCSQTIFSQRKLLNFPSGSGGNYEQSAPSNTFGALAASSGEVVANTVTTAPDLSNLNQDITAFGMVCGIMSFMILGFLFFKGWDVRDHHVLIYIKNANRNQLSKIQKNNCGNNENARGETAIVAESDNPLSGEIQGLEAGLKEFFHQILPSGTMFKTEATFRAFLTATLSYHDWIRMWTYSSLRRTRSIRFLVLCNNVLIIMFVNTIFYSVFFPSTCKGYSKSQGGSNATCLSSTSSWSHNSTCVWNAGDGTCSINPPPSSMMFYAEVALLVSLFSLIPSAALDFIMSEYCSRRPVLESIGLVSRDWLGRPSDPSENGMKVARKSELGLALLQQKLSTDRLNILNEIIDPLENDDVKYVYCNALSAKEELLVIMDDVKVFLDEYASNPPVPWRGISVNSELEARKEAIMSQLGIYSDGSPVPLTFLQKLYFGNARKKLLWKLDKVRHMEGEILNTMDTLAEGEEDMRDRCLIQYFVLEQFTSLKRYAVRFTCHLRISYHTQCLRYYCS